MAKVWKSRTGVAGQPPKSTPDVEAKAREYLQIWQLVGDKVPSIEGLASYVKITPRTFYSWEEADRDNWREILAELRYEQARHLINGGLGGSFNASITKMLLTKHGYRDHVIQDVNNPDGRLERKPIDLTGLSDEQLHALAGIAGRNSDSAK